MTKYDDGRLEDFWEFNLDLGDRFPLEVEAIVGANLEFVSAWALLFVIAFREYVIRLNNTFFIFDAIGLGLFVVVGIAKTLDFGFPMWVAIVMGTITGSFGGMMRDILINEEPLIFRKDIYALACVFGGLIYYICMQTSMSAAMIQFVSALSVFLARIIAVKYHISVPVLKGEE